ncbi:macrolide family glycosyltransferase [Actinokineospora iranica]|uniref:Glycosyltransferase, MGT family n=1 Tax=Actinokineospora iranica TaxID=1271860 RepID=A0A1G6U186_9PSEU|nr:macrolide family glycosyltransferase [Actinokineospora iranica]SDD35108.1 glycosyltransferase, MGT family [Actinokineospora iranica]
MKKHFAFIALPAAGHINPTLPLVEELRGRGHRVTYAVNEHFADAVEAAGAEPFVVDWRLPPVTADAGRTTEQLAEMLMGFLTGVKRVLPDLDRWVAEDIPDAICYDMMTLPGRLLATRYGVPEVATVANFAGNESFDLGSLLTPPDFDPTHPKFAEYLAEIAKIMADYGLSFGEERITGGMVAPLNLVFIPREFQIRGDTFDDRFRFIGPSVGSRATGSQWRPPADGSPVLFVSLGTVFNDRADFFTLCAKAFAGTRWHVAMAVGDRVDPSALGEIPPNFDVRPRFPQPAVLDHATAFLSHTGMNSTMEALLNQVPLAAVPQTPEQTANARRVEELGLGRLIDTEALTPDALRAAVEEVAEDQNIRAALAAMAKHLHAAGGPTAGADALETYLATTPPDE